MTHRAARRVLIVEDEYLVAMELEALLAEMGYQVVGPAARMNEAIDLAREAEIETPYVVVLGLGLGVHTAAALLRRVGASPAGGR